MHQCSSVRIQFIDTHTMVSRMHIHVPTHSLALSLSHSLTVSLTLSLTLIHFYCFSRCVQRLTMQSSASTDPVMQHGVESLSLQDRSSCSATAPSKTDTTSGTKTHVVAGVVVRLPMKVRACQHPPCVLLLHCCV